MAKKDQKTRCPECGEVKLIKDYERAELICTNCGLVIKEKMMNLGPEWRIFDKEQTKERVRVGAPTTYTIHDKGLTTMIDWRNKDVHGKNLPPIKRTQIYRLRRLQKRLSVSSVIERNLVFALSELNRMASHLNLPKNVRESAAVIYRKAVELNLIKGRSIEEVAAAAIYVACRKCKVPITLDEISEISRVKKKNLGRNYRFLAKKLHILFPPANPIDYIPKFTSDLGLSNKVQNLAIDIVKQACLRGITFGKGPKSIAAAAIYIASMSMSERRTQRQIAQVTRVTEVTIRNRYKELVEKLDLNISQNISRE